MKSPWVWKASLVPACLVLAFGLIGLIYPDPYIDFYLEKTASTTLAVLSATQPGIGLLLEVIFRANGLGMTMSGILAIFIILFPLKRGEKWALPALAIAGGIGLVGEIVLEILAL